MAKKKKAKEKTIIEKAFEKFYYEFMALADYIWKMEESISGLLEEEKLLWESMTAEKIRIMRASWESWKLLDIFPRTLRYSYITIIYSHVETKLTEICNLIRENNNLSLRLSHLSGSLIEKSKRYISSYASFSLSTIDWSVIDELTKVRNCIVHCNGNILNSRDQQFLRDLCSSNNPKKKDISLF